MPAIASLEDLKAAQKKIYLAAKIERVEGGTFKKYRRIGWKTI